MKRTITVLGVLLVLMLALAGCGGGKQESASESLGDAALNENYSDALPVSAQLAMGTLMLEGTEDAVSVEQAGELLPTWQMLKALQDSGTAADAEIEAVVDQVQSAMTSGQLAAIQELRLTSDSMTELVQERGLARGMAGGGGQAGGFTPPAGGIPGSGGGRGGDAVPGAENLNPKDQEGALAERMNALAGTLTTDMVIALLQARAQGEAIEVASLNQDIELQRALLDAVAEVTGLDQQEIASQSREGKTPAEIAEANGADVDGIVAQIAAAETQRIDQALADGTLEQGDADAKLADLETLIREMLEQPLQLGGRGATVQP